MFGPKQKQLDDLHVAYDSFVEVVRGLSPEKYLHSLGDWTPRDIAAHLLGWNRITVAGCADLREGVEPFYFYDGTNDYRKVNAKFLTQFPSRDRTQMMNDLSTTMAALVTYLKTIPDDEWEADTGLVHYRGDAATPARCVDSLIRDYRKHREEIRAGATT